MDGKQGEEGMKQKKGEGKEGKGEGEVEEKILTAGSGEIGEAR